MSWSDYKQRSLKPDIEILCLVVFMSLVFMCYGVIAEIASHSPFNYASLLVTPLDKLIPFQTTWSLFYEVAFVIPLIVFVMIRVTAGAQVAVFQRIALAMLALILCSFIIFLLFPSNVFVLHDVPAVALTGFDGRFVQLVYHSIGGWNAFPSTHTSVSWLFFRIFATFYKRWYARLIFLLWFFAMLAGTVTLRVHNIIDVLAGVLLAEAIFCGVYVALTRRRMHDLNRHFSIKQEVIFILSISACLAAFLFYFIRHYGVHTIL